MLLVLILVLPALGGVVSRPPAGGPGRPGSAVGTNAAMLGTGDRALRPGRAPRRARRALRGAARRCAERLHGGGHRGHRRAGLLARRPHHRRASCEGRCSGRRATLYAVLVQVFVTTMVLAVLAANLGVLWVGVEATTVVDDLPGRPPPHQGIARGLVEVHRHLLGGDRARLLGDRARLPGGDPCRRPLGPRPRLDLADGAAPATSIPR